MTISKNEVLCVTYKKENGAVFYITRKRDDRNVYFIYRNDNDNLVKLGKGNNPIELENKFI